MPYTIESADNGWIISWWDEVNGEHVNHHQVFEIPDSVNTETDDPQALIDLLYFIKESVCGQYYSKHKVSNVVVKFETNTAQS